MAREGAGDRHLPLRLPEPVQVVQLSAPNTTVNFTNPATFGKVSTSTSDEGTTANAGGQGLMNITLSFRF